MIIRHVVSSPRFWMLATVYAAHRRAAAETVTDLGMVFLDRLKDCYVRTFLYGKCYIALKGIVANFAFDLFGPPD